MALAGSGIMNSGQNGGAGSGTKPYYGGVTGAYDTKNQVGGAVNHQS